MAVQSINNKSNVITEKFLFIQIGTQEKLVLSLTCFQDKQSDNCMQGSFQFLKNFIEDLFFEFFRFRFFLRDKVVNFSPVRLF